LHPYIAIYTGKIDSIKEKLPANDVIQRILDYKFQWAIID